MADPYSTSGYWKLPAETEALLRQVSAPPRLVAHLVLVHDVACKLVQEIRLVFPAAAFDSEAVCFGASIHDFGKAATVEELVRPGKDHEQRGFEMLRQMGISEERARFAYTHGNWDASDASLEDFIVALADNCWKGKRVDQLEMRIVGLLSSGSGQPAWDSFGKLDSILDSLCKDADSRLAWQSVFQAQ